MGGRPYCILNGKSDATVFFTPSGKIPKLKSSRSDTVFGKIITHPGIQYRQQFTHTCRNGNLIRLTLRQQALIEIPNKRFKTCRYHGSHIQRLTHRRPSAEAAAFEFGFPALPRVRGNTDQTRYPFVVQPSNSGSIAISVAVVIEPMPLICSATLALPSKCVWVWSSICLSNSSISRSK